MGEKFKDFPCFYYLENRVNRKSRIQFYSMLSAMFGQTQEQAAQNSELFAHASGKLFGGTGYTVDEINAHGGKCFEKPYQDCRGFYRRKAYSDAELKDKCCIICPYAHSYQNFGLEQERQILRVLMEEPGLLILTNCSTGDFHSRLTISCSNDLSEYPAIPFNAYLFEYIIHNESFVPEELISFVNKTLTENELCISEEAISSFVSAQLGIISRTPLSCGDNMSSLIYSLNSLRESKYIPPLLVHATSEGAGKKKSTLSPGIQNDLIRLYDEVSNIQFVTDPESTNDFSSLAYQPYNTEAGGINVSLPEIELSSVSSPDIEAGTATKESEQLLDFSSLACGFTGNNHKVLESISEATAIDEEAESIEDDLKVVVESDVQSDSTLEPMNISGPENESVLIEHEEEPCFTVFPEEIFSEAAGEGTAMDESEGESAGEFACIVESCVVDKMCEEIREPSDAGVPVVTITTVSASSSALSESAEESNVYVQSDDFNPCCICHGVSPDNYCYSAEWVRNLYRHCMSCENAISKEQEKPFHSTALSHPPVATGCAFSHNKCDSDCIYNNVPVILTEDFISIIEDCSDYTCDLSKIVSFIDACDNASSMSIECVQIYGVEGLLFYVSGSYYFIGGGTTACAALKQLLSNAKKLTLYSTNPLLVHTKLLSFGLRHIKIESIAVKYSVFAGTDLLLPPSIMFVTEEGIDMYRSIMPQYEKLYERIELSDDETKRYEKLKRLEWALASSVDTSYIALGHNRSVYGSNALNYRFALLDVERICREGVLYVVTLDEESAIPAAEAKVFWEDVAGRLASSSLSCMNYAFILGLGNGISYFTCFEEEAFFDSLMASARSAYKKAYKKEVHLQVVQEKYVTNQTL